jgi:hypothetical protein
MLATYSQVRPITYLALLGLTLAFVCAVIGVVHGMLIAPEGDLTKAMSFDAAVGIYLLTIALFVPLAHFTPKGLKHWMGWTVGLGLYSFTIETGQILRGLDPRFSRVAGPVDQIAGAVFFLVALGILSLFVILMVKLFRRKAVGPEALVLLGIRYAAIASSIAFAAGIWMTAAQGRKFGAAGNILPLHALGFHALQGIPLVAWLLSQSNVAVDTARRWIQVSGIAWAAACVFVAWQTAAGQPVTEVSVAMGLAVAAMLVWAISFLRASQSWLAPQRARATAGVAPH